MTLTPMQPAELDIQRTDMAIMQIVIEEKCTVKWKGYDLKDLEDLIIIVKLGTEDNSQK